MRKIHVNGSTFMSGATLPPGQENTKTFSALLKQKLKIPVVNRAVNGATNEDIFVQTCESILVSDADVIFVEWTGPGKVNFRPSATTVVVEESENDTVYNQYVKLSSYLPLIKSLEVRTNKKVYHITSYLPFYEKLNKLPSTPGSADHAEYEKWPNDLKKVVDPTGTMTPEQFAVQVNGLKTLTTTIASYGRWMNQFRNIKQFGQDSDIFGPEVLHMDLAGKFIRREWETLKKLDLVN